MYTTVKHLNPLIRERLYKEGFGPEDRADLAVPQSSLAPKGLGDIVRLARTAGVRPSLVFRWMKQRKSVQEERLAALGDHPFLDLRGCVDIRINQLVSIH